METYIWNTEHAYMLTAIMRRLCKNGYMNIVNLILH
jgi:hypothetical protein